MSAFLTIIQKAKFRGVTKNEPSSSDLIVEVRKAASNIQDGTVRHGTATIANLQKSVVQAVWSYLAGFGACVTTKSSARFKHGNLISAGITKVKPSKIRKGESRFSNNPSSLAYAFKGGFKIINGNDCQGYGRGLATFRLSAEAHVTCQRTEQLGPKSEKAEANTSVRQIISTLRWITIALAAYLFLRNDDFDKFLVIMYRFETKYIYH